ncbi:citrate lyase holo-[acyl-carrier protein] synthase [Trichococcus ilyis]|uniref:citrate lyase holo-[acyl-carrier protein] synthase n=1 Tax=Trichococcus ilyis TaxID=640938 RepID=A0A143ZCV2_9LACT|nr:citrate lyase holo-[acyl-carrier protein] synthase [Trichococcus ilyis]CZR10208.1 apo-citrate lyase phosphoribosyl-dephospho-coa transferase [Trichococcus ilyis]SEJ93754.1 holo-ACP synthase [Trichococcus ilyis]
MTFNLFRTGKAVQLDEILRARDKRAAKQRELLTLYPTHSLLVATLNIPGPIKDVPILDEVFQNIRNAIHTVLTEVNPLSSHYSHVRTGQEYFLTVPIAPESLKQLMVEIEENHPYGRVVDLDVLFLEDGHLRSISRNDLEMPMRKCYLCGEDAKICGRSRAHSIEEIQQKISRIILFNQ